MYQRNCHTRYGIILELVVEVLSWESLMLLPPSWPAKIQNGSRMHKLIAYHKYNLPIVQQVLEVFASVFPVFLLPP